MPREGEGKSLARRTFLGIGWGAVVASILGMLAATVRFLVPNVLFEPAASFKIGKPNDYAPGSVTFIPERKIFVIRALDGSFQTLTATCPHLRCVVRWIAEERVYECPCHGSRFTDRGKVTAGPAPGPLEWYEVTLATDGRLYVNTLVQVRADYRLTV
ncbi:MAG: Rieske 2Fe-2S domain-containing protein [Acidobacteria bacterium]|nr:Rieske 2Fe-2S domain-containing protein [Acidobacteriota bacterium]